MLDTAVHGYHAPRTGDERRSWCARGHIVPEQTRESSFAIQLRAQQHPVTAASRVNRDVTPCKKFEDVPAAKAPALMSCSRRFVTLDRFRSSRRSRSPWVS